MSYGSGIRLRDVRKMRNMTQRQLGLEVGFSETTAESRISQYELGIRKPRKKMLESLAKVLDVEIFMLNPPYWRTDYEVMHTLFSLNKRFEMIFEKIGNHCYIRFDDYSMNLNLLEWKENLDKFINKELTLEEYNEWMYTYPHEREKKAIEDSDSSEKYDKQED